MFFLSKTAILTKKGKRVAGANGWCYISGRIGEIFGRGIQATSGGLRGKTDGGSCTSGIGGGGGGGGTHTRRGVCRRRGRLLCVAGRPLQLRIGEGKRADYEDGGDNERTTVLLSFARSGAVGRSGLQFVRMFERRRAGQAARNGVRQASRLSLGSRHCPFSPPGTRTARMTLLRAGTGCW